MSDFDESSCAFLGGEPLFPEGQPAWPILDDGVRAVFEEFQNDPAWGSYLGPQCDRLRERLSDMFDDRDVHLCSSGTGAVELALIGLGVGTGDEVVLSSYDFKANLVNVRHRDATPVLVGLSETNWHPTPEQIVGGFNERTKAVLLSHLHGGVIDMPAVAQHAASAGVPVIEDICQMPEATIAGRRVGLWGDIAVLSFGGSKLLSAGRGGAVVSSRADVMQRIRLHVERGNDLSPLSELQAAVLLPQLDRLAEREQQRRAGVKILTAHLPPGITPLINPIDAEPGYYKLGLKYDPSPNAGLSRDRFAEAVQAEGVALYPGFRALHRITSRRRFTACGDLSEADRADEGMLVLHHPVLLEPEPTLLRVAEAFRRVHDSAAEIASRLDD